MAELTETYETLGRYNDALGVAREALELSRNRNGDVHELTLSAMSDLSDIFRKMSQLERAKEIDKEAYENSKKLYGINSLERVSYINNLAGDYIQLKEKHHALPLYEELYELYTEANVDMPFKQMVNVFIAADMYEKVIDACKVMLEKAYRRALPSLEEFLDQLYTKRVLAIAYHHTGAYSDALATYVEIVNDYEDLRENYDFFAAQAEKTAWFSSIVEIYKEAAYLAHMTNNPELSFQLSELCRTRNLVDQFSKHTAQINSLFLKEDIQKLKDYETQLATYEERMKMATVQGNREAIFNIQFAQGSLLNEYSAYKRQLQEKYPQYRRQLALQKRYALRFSKYNRKLLSKGTHLIAFSIYEEKGAILAHLLGPDNNIQLVHISIDEYFLAKCRLYHELLSYSNITALKSDNKYIWKFANGEHMILRSRQTPNKGAKLINSAREFRELRQNLSEYIGTTLLSPMSHDLTQSPSWIIVPDKDLNSIPFESLQFRGQTVIASFDISYVPSYAILKLMKDREEENSHLKNRKELFAMGNAIYENTLSHRSDMSIYETDIKKAVLNRGLNSKNFDLTRIAWKNLPGTKQELEQVAALFEDSKKVIYKEREATESHLKSLNKNGDLKNYKYILFAAHGLFLPEFPELSSVVLSQGIETMEDGYITVEEWMGYNLGSDLVYLSACESGLGEYQVGEGIIGIPYALCIAGNKDTIMSLWKVADTQTARFSAMFFEKLSKGESLSVAFNSTKREFMLSKNPKYNDPSVWSAFLLYGI